MSPRKIDKSEPNSISVKVVDDELIIRLPLHSRPLKTTTGRWMIASTMGTLHNLFEYQGEKVSVLAWASIRDEEWRKTKRVVNSRRT